MKITIIGAGSVGTHLAKYLSGEQMDIFIVDTNAEKLMSLNAEYNLMTIV
ncbi:MAG: NAD-binding protein, partial [Muribaculaceae bacterium]|nr:NAD-binding protein [Muribaculaceae bacterium]